MSKANGSHHPMGLSAVSDRTRAHQVLNDHRTIPSLPRVEVNGRRLLIKKAKGPNTPDTHLARDGDEYLEVDDEPSLREATQDQRLRRLVEDGQKKDAQTTLPSEFMETITRQGQH